MKFNSICYTKEYIGLEKIQGLRPYPRKAYYISVAIHLIYDSCFSKSYDLLSQPRGLSASYDRLTLRLGYGLNYVLKW